MTLDWVDAEIERLTRCGNLMENVQALSQLLIVRDHLRRVAPDSMEEKKPPAWVISPTLEDVESAINNLAIISAEQRQQALNARTWARMAAAKSELNL